MFLIDYLSAVKYLATVLESTVSICFQSITHSAFCDRIIFTADDGQTSYVVGRNGRVEIHYHDTWRNPEHKTILRKEAKTNIW